MIDSLLKWIRPEIRNLTAYHVADADGLVKLDAMENPYSLPSDLMAELLQRVSHAALNRYPDPSSAELIKTLSKAMDVPEGKSILLGNGSDELIQMLAMTVSENERCILSFDPGFVMYRMIAGFVGMQYIGVPLTQDYEIDMAVTRDAIIKNKPAIIFIAYPNNPTANCFSRHDIEEIIRLAPGLVVVDEAYNPFAQDTFMPMLKTYDQLLVMRTVSKMGLAGLRLGLLCGHPEIVNQIDKIRLPYNINVLTQVAAKFVLEHVDILEQQAVLIREERESMLLQMRSIDGIRVFPSSANFILFRVDRKTANDVFESIKAQGILIKNMKATSGLLNQCLRVTVGTVDENRRFISALNKALT